ncbi:uncharacterized protein LOC126902781 [Daktulosphaira vitifoliae]|uniref:uncharacterized protein LOC126902781 n=1 Tax=Daktulosphaira vitifoliae TaxID=58002 RepID=UPI0021AA7868|nr:uncharacterized protein LOC126902781 [Daktulosphaira vitifoliae]
MESSRIARTNLSCSVGKRIDRYGRQARSSNGMWSISNGDTNWSSKAKSPCVLINEYTAHSSVHGVRYMTNANPLEKIFWLIMLAICGMSACYIASKLWLRYRAVPTILAVKDTHVPLYQFPFPSITVCPAIKVKKTVGFNYLSKYVNVENDTIRAQVEHIMSALSMMQQPTYFRMEYHINLSKTIFRFFKNVNVTDFMLATLPTCDEILGLCKWHGQRMNCCEVFSLQRTEEGFCYSFNSLTSERGKHCPLSEVLENEGIVEEDNIMYPGCQLRRNTAVGTVTGLEVFLRAVNSSESLGMEQRDVDGAKVLVHTSYQFPSAGDGLWLDSVQGRRLSIMVLPDITVTSKNVKEVDVNHRDCVFPDERELYIYHVYTQSSCYIQCRLEYVLYQCGCHLYFFITPNDGYPVCGIPDFECVLHATRHLRLLTPPIGTLGFEPKLLHHSLNCTHCRPTCYETTYQLEINYSLDQNPLVWKYFGYLDVAYINLGATKYQRDITFVWTDLLVALGGVANLFLGFSILSVVEFVYWALKIFVNTVIGFSNNVKCSWLVIVLLSFFCASFLVNTMWLKFSASPTVTAVKDTHLALYLIPFPAVSVCPIDKIKRSLAYEYIAERINDTYNEAELDNFLNALTFFQHPVYSRMIPYLNGSKNLIYKLASINITEFMLKVLPTCDEVFNACYWIGHFYKCCELFSLQRTEEGFCYSFNSLNSIDAIHCPETNPIDIEQNLFTNRSNWDCILKRNTAAGSTTGLQLFFKKLNESERLINASYIIGPSSVRVQIFYVTEYPESGMGSVVLAETKNKLSITLKPYVTISTDAIRKLPIEDRFCYFPDEQQLSISKSYTQKSCLIECRLNYINEKCHCRPYYYNMLGKNNFCEQNNRIPICNSTQLLCIALHNSELRFYSPPIGNIRGFMQGEVLSPLNCSQCLPTCHESVYDVDVDSSYDSQQLSRESYGSVDIFYKNEGAVKYQRDVTFGWIDLLVSFGGIAGLFLGFSLLTIIEFLYWGVKLLIYHCATHCFIQKKVSPK